MHNLPIFENVWWTVSHRRNSALPGYLVVSARSAAAALDAMPPEALATMGPVLAATQHALDKVLQPARVYIGRYGHMPGQPFHFHVIPVYSWVERLFRADACYHQLQASEPARRMAPPMARS